MRKLQGLILLFFASFSVQTAVPFSSGEGQYTPEIRGSAKVYEDVEGYSLLSLVLDNEAKDQKVDRISISDRTNVVLELALCNQLPQEFRPAADDLRSKSKSHLRLKRKLKLNRPYSLTSGGATDFSISSVGFDVARTHAIVAVFRGCGVMCSGGWTYLLRKTGNGWQIVSQICEVMS